MLRPVWRSGVTVRQACAAALIAPGWSRAPAFVEACGFAPLRMGWRWLSPQASPRRLQQAVLVSSAALIGLFPPPHGSAMRTLWRELFPDDAGLSSAFSFDATAEEVLFVSGPPLVALVMAATQPPVGLLLTAALAVMGTFAMTSSPLVRRHPRVPHAADRPHTHLLRMRGIPPLLATTSATGLALGAIEVAVPYVAQRHHHASLAGVLLGLISVGSIVGGLVHGRRTWTGPVGRGSCSVRRHSRWPARCLPSPPESPCWRRCSCSWGCSWPRP
jgi:hypothetical protein